jgi:hypothetical protein
MRATDNRYAAERERFDLAIRMIGHEARTGTIRYCTGFSEDRIRKICASYFPGHGGALRRRRGKTPSQIAPFVSSAGRQGEASLLTGLLVHEGLAELDQSGPGLKSAALSRAAVGQGFCAAYEHYLALHPAPQLSFEWGWNLYRSLISTRELLVAWCALCDIPYVQDAYALDYERCPYCEVKDHA